MLQKKKHPRESFAWRIRCPTIQISDTSGHPGHDFPTTTTEEGSHFPVPVPVPFRSRLIPYSSIKTKVLLGSATRQQFLLLAGYYTKRHAFRVCNMMYLYHVRRSLSSSAGRMMFSSLDSECAQRISQKLHKLSGRCD